MPSVVSYIYSMNASVTVTVNADICARLYSYFALVECSIACQHVCLSVCMYDAYDHFCVNCTL